MWLAHDFLPHNHNIKDLCAIMCCGGPELDHSIKLHPGGHDNENDESSHKKSNHHNHKLSDHGDLYQLSIRTAQNIFQKYTLKDIIFVNILNDLHFAFNHYQKNPKKIRYLDASPDISQPESALKPVKRGPPMLLV